MKLNNLIKTLIVKTYLLLFFLLLITFSCDPEVCRECSKIEFNTSEWINNDEFSFIGNDSTIHTFTIIDSIKSEGKQCIIGTNEEDVICVKTLSYTINCESLNTKIFYTFSHFDPFIEQTDENKQVIVSLIFSNNNNLNGFYREFQINPFEAYKNNANYLDSVEFNNKKYYDVLELDARQLFEEINYKKVFFSKNNGIIRLIDNQDAIFDLK